VKGAFDLKGSAAGLAALFLLMLASPAEALDVIGPIETDTVWGVEDSPVRVMGDIILPTGRHLAVDPGVRVVFTGPYSFVVNGELHAVGTGEDTIVFTAEQPDIDSLRWKGIRFINAARDCRLVFCRIEQSWARGVWPENCGGAIYIEGSSPTVSQCEILRNRADGDGGGIYGWFSTATFQNSLITMNYSYCFGGGFYIGYSSMSIINCTVAYDTARAWGGGIYVGAEGTPSILNCIINNNTKKDSLLGIHLQPGDDFFHDIARANSADPTVSFCDVYRPGQVDPFPGTGNIAQVPGFIDVVEHPYDFHLQYSSPCIDAGDPNMSPGDEPDVLVNRINMGAYGGTDEATISVPVIHNDLYELGVAVNYDSVRIDTTAGRTGSPVSAEIRIENHGHYRLHLYDFRFTSPDFFPEMIVEEGDTIPVYRTTPVEPGERENFTINFRPVELRSYLDTLTIISSDTLHPAPFVELTGVGIAPIVEMDSTLDFGPRQIGASHLVSLDVHNSGRSELRVYSVNVQGDGFDAEVVDHTIAAGGTGEVNFTFSPTIPQSYEAAATVRTNDKNPVVILRGSGSGPKMVVEDSTLFSGYVYVGGDTSTYMLTISNEGNDTLHVTGAAVTNPAFSVGLPDTGLFVAEEESALLPVHFHPQQAGVDYEGLLTISSNYPVPHTVALSGRGMAEPGRYVFGEVAGVWGWSEGDPDYIVLDSVYVPAHQRLRIMPGARILFEPGAFMSVLGELRAVGLPTDSIHFLPRDPSGGTEAQWGGLDLAFEDATRLAYCVIKGSRNGLFITESSPLIQFCTIAENGDETLAGGGIHIVNSGAEITGCIIENNIAGGGGGIFIRNSKPTVTNCVIRNNRAQGGGGIHLYFLAGALIQSNLIYGNSGGAVHVIDHSAPRMVNNTITDNSGGGIFADLRSIPVLINTILWHNDGPEMEFGRNANALVSYCDVEGGFVGNANLDVEPGFVGPAAGDYHLSDSSPLIDQGNPEASFRDYFFPPSLGSELSDIGAYGGPLGGGWEIPEVAITVFQSPAFPRWIDLFITALDTLQGAPTCSLEFAGSERVPIELTQNQGDPLAYRGSYEVPGSGTLFITVDAVLSVDRRQKAGRVYEVILLGPGVDGLMRLVGVDGWLRLPSGAADKPLVVLTGFDPEPLKPAEGLLFLTPQLTVSGTPEPLLVPGGLSIEIDAGDWTEDDSRRLGIYRFDEDGWTRLEGGYLEGRVTGVILQGGRFAVAWDAGFTPSDSEPVPESIGLLHAYPNPFNREVTIEFDLVEAGDARLSVYDLAGRRVADLLDRHLQSGSNEAVWDGNDSDGQPLPSGIYWVRLEGVQGYRPLKLLLLR